MAGRRGRPARSRSRSTQRRLRRHAERLSRDVMVILLFSMVLAMTAAVLCLLAIGPPPPIRLDVFWVRQNELLVRGVVIALAGAAIAAGPLVVARRSRLLAILLWMMFLAACFLFFSDRLVIIHRVLWHYVV